MNRDGPLIPPVQAERQSSLFPPFLAPLLRYSSVTLSVFLFALALFAFSFRLGAGPIHRTMEGREALVMQEMLRSDNWILPLRNGETIPSKPPLLHWCGVAVAKLTGELSEWAARLPNAFFSALSVALTCLLGCRLSGREVGVLAGLIVLTTPMVVEMGREAWVDPALSFFVLTALVCFSSMYEDDQWRGWRRVLFYLALAGGVLSKGPIGYVLPLVVIAAYLTVKRDLWRLRDLFSVFGVFLAVGIPLTWYALAFLQQGWPFIHKQVLQENLLRFAAGSGKRIPSAAFFFGPFLMEGLPWSVLFCWGVWKFAQHAPVREKGVFPLVWWVAMVGFFSVSAGKRDVYLLPTYPAMALFVAEWGWPFIPITRRPFPRAFRFVLMTVAIILAGGLLLSAFCAARGLITIDSPWLDTWFGDSKWSNIALYLRFWAEHPLYGVSLFAVLCGGAVWMVERITSGRWRDAVWIVMGLLLLVTLGVHPYTRNYAKEYKALTGFATAIRSVVPSESSFHFYTPEEFSSEFDEFSQIYFYLDRHVPLAPCSEQPDFARCPPGYYLLRWKKWKLFQDSPQAHLVLDSDAYAGPNSDAHLVLVQISSP